MSRRKEELQNWYQLKLFTPCSDANYQSPNVITTAPLIDGKIETRRTTINITYNVQIKPATGNVTIYATDGVKKYFRQTFSPISFQHYQLDERNQTLILDVLTSTFNQPNMTYYAVLDNGFVQSMEDGEPILGIPGGKWKFRTGKHEHLIFQFLFQFFFARKINS